MLDQDMELYLSDIHQTLTKCGKKFAVKTRFFILIISY